MTTPIQSAKGIPPCEYVHYLDSTISRLETANRLRRRKIMLRRILMVAITLPVIFVLAIFL